ncbi:hypothetical protein [Pseudarthrobacter polychromogenes]|uniref:Uncharacterized protein n=1 Tax=Pseudarthrobacter polychromogenes TaxID=1676 RepID=A0ABQ1X9D1_9MICC|nr:hypothetical protein [Pseudarthrobacter polychromogenes]GGG83909.1 hypothetical protein GCM10011577_01720 [Pseudarthrobacter polychromogenes]
MEIGFVVVEYNQASGQPEINGEEVYTDREAAEEAADIEQLQASARGRRERFLVGTISIDEEDLS